MANTIPLSTVEQLLNEFNFAGTSNARKHEIEKQLMEFQNNIQSWPQCLMHLNGNGVSANQFLWFFKVSTIEAALTRKWKHLDENDRFRMRDALWSNYVNMSVSMTPRIQREKIAHLIALMGKREFPDVDAAYVQHIIELMRTNFMLGIILLRTTSEEVVSTRDDIASDRKKYFHSNLSLCLAEIFQLLTQYLIIVTCGINGIDLSHVPNNLVDHKLIEALPKDQSLDQCTVELLNCIQHLLSWIVLNDLVHEQFVLNLFDLATVKENRNNVSVAALNAISELFYRQRAIPYPHVVAKGIKAILCQTKLSASDEQYQDKLTEVLRLFMAQQWTKWIENGEICPDIINALYSYTFLNCAAFAFAEKLAIWQPIISGLSRTGFGRYTQTIHLLISGILQKIQFRFDADLSILDNESLDDDMMTEWQQYLTQCIETIALVAETQPLEVFEQVYNEWCRPFETFKSLEKLIDSNGSLSIQDNQKTQFIGCMLRDLSTMCQTLTRLASSLQGCIREIPQNLTHLTYCLLYAIKLITAKRLHSWNATNSTLNCNFIELLAQLLNSVRNLLPWSTVLQSENEMRPLIDHVAQILLPPPDVLQEPRILTLAAAQLILSISSQCRPKYMLDCTNIKQLMQNSTNLSYLDRHAETLTRNAIINCFVLPWPNCMPAEQELEKRTFLLQEYIHSLSRDLLNIDHTLSSDGQQEKITKVVIVTLPMLKDIADFHRESNSSVKQMIAAAYRPIIAKSLLIFNQNGSNVEEVANYILNFSLSVIQTLQIQLGATSVREMLDLFVEATMREQFSTRRLKRVEKLMQMLLLVVQQPGSLGMHLLPSVLHFALTYVAPMLTQGKSLNDYYDTALTLYSLFDGILHNRWQYFYKSQVLRGFSPGASDIALPAEEDNPEHSDQLLAILTAYGQALVTVIDPHITRTVLASLQSLNDRWKLFERNFFKANLQSSFLFALMKSLLSPDGTLHQEQLINVLFAMAQPNVNALHSAFVELGYMPESKIVEEICLAKDLPTFSAKVAQIIQDTKCIQYS